MAYKKDQGRYARMVAFWSLCALLAYGCLTGLVPTLRAWIGKTDPWIDPFPLLGKFDLPTAIALGVLAVCSFALYGFLNRPKPAEILIETESELHKVTWPTFPDTWHGTLAVVVTVMILFVFLLGADMALTFLLRNALGSG